MTNAELTEAVYRLNRIASDLDTCCIEDQDSYNTAAIDVILETLAKVCEHLAERSK